jgi:ATP-dependent protease ClpP protease subunit
MAKSQKQQPRRAGVAPLLSAMLARQGGTPKAAAAPMRWFEVNAAAEEDRSAEIYIYGNIGDRWDENGVIAADLVKELAALDVDTIVLRINSYGGSVPDGLAIFNALRRHKAQVDVVVDGVAISCAGYIAMAGDTITMAENAQLMIHAPWSYAVGNSQMLREQADILDRYAKSLAGAYADKSGKPIEDCLALLTDGKDHWFSAEEAVAEGYADQVGEAVAVAASLAHSFDLSRFQPPQAAAQPPARPRVSQPAAAAASTQEPSMPEPVNPAATQPAATTTAAAPAASPAAPAQQPAATGRTKEQNCTVLAMFKPFLAHAGVQDLQTEVLSDPALTVEQIQARLLNKVGEGAGPANPNGAYPKVSTVNDEADKRRAAMAQSIIVRAGYGSKDIRASISANPYRGHKLLDMARASLQAAGVRTDGMSQMDVVAAAFTQSTSDFPVVLENAMHKTLLAAYALQAMTWSRFCKRGTVSDFRAHNRYRFGSIGTLDSKNELGEFKNKAIPDGEKGSITAGTKGNIINLSREAIINDDLGAFMGLSNSLGQAAARTVEVAVYTLLAQNAGLGPTMGDGFTLFHANHNNIGTGAAIAMAALDADRVLMASQKDVGNNDYLGLRPAVLLVPIGLGGTARSINEAQYDPDTANKLQKPNIVNGLFRDIVDTPRLSGTRRYLFADPNEAPVIEVAFLDGAEEPFLEQETGFTVDGSRWKARLDFGTAAIDFRGAVTNAGTP